MSTTVEITKPPRSYNVNKLRIPEPTSLWSANPKEWRRIVLEAKRTWAVFRTQFGFMLRQDPSELVFGSLDNQKFQKSLKTNGGDGTLIVGLSFAQSRISGINMCPCSTPECVRHCVGFNGNNNYPSIMRARIAKTRFLFEHPEEAGYLMADFWDKAQNKGSRLGVEVGGRPNTYSDCNWVLSAPWMFEHFQGIHFFDYTKVWDRVSPYENYHLTYSASERTTDEEIINYVSNGNNVAVVFSSWTTLPTQYLGLTVFNGDKEDARWKDPIGCVVGLKRKGTLKASSPMCRAA